MVSIADNLKTWLQSDSEKYPVLRLVQFNKMW